MFSFFVFSLGSLITYSKDDPSLRNATDKQVDNFFGIQFHPEVTHTTRGNIIFKNFVYSICKIKKNWSSKKQKERLIKEIRQKIGRSKVLCALSGGVDSSVVSKLLYNAVGKNLVCIFVNTGLLRKNEETEVINTFNEKKLSDIFFQFGEERFSKRISIFFPWEPICLIAESKNPGYNTLFSIFKTYFRLYF